MSFQPLKRENIYIRSSSSADDKNVFQRNTPDIVNDYFFYNIYKLL